MIARRVDSMGRVVIPREMREKLGITHDTYMDISLNGGHIELRKSGRTCTICGSDHDMLKDTGVCVSCAREIAEKLASNE